jgi:hypothetical protein
MWKRTSGPLGVFRIRVCVYGGALRDMEGDYSVLHGYLYSSRYITRDVMDRYGLNPNNYTGPAQLTRIRERLAQCLDPDMRVQTREELVALLGASFEWVHTAASGVSHIDRHLAC